MATAGDGEALCESGGAGEKFRKRHIRTETSSGISEEGGNSGNWISKLGKSLKQVTGAMSALSISTIPHGYFRFEVQHPDTMENLPDELLVNIFVRLQARQLARMRTVSKSWNVLLSQPSFVKSHLHHSIRNNNQRILLVFPHDHNHFTQYSCQSSHLEPINVIKHTPTNIKIRSEVIGWINGLVCLKECSYIHIWNPNFHIWNPSLSAVSTIPSPHFIPPTSRYVSTSMRFRFDPKNDDYKIVWIVGLADVMWIVKEWVQVQVYSMRKRSWKSITQPVPSHIIGIYDTNMLCVDSRDGYLHWKSESVVNTIRTELILAFDLDSETFHEIPRPDYILDSNHKFHRLGFLGGKLCEMSWLMDGGLEVWVMEEYGVRESWVKRHTISRFDDCNYLGFTSRNELLLEDEDRHLVLYDPVANKTKFTRTNQTDETYAIVEYVDSLVWY